MEVGAPQTKFLYQMGELLRTSQQQATQKMQEGQAKVERQAEQVMQTALQSVQTRISTSKVDTYA